jgi:aarF domain-containing kinase
MEGRGQRLKGGQIATRVVELCLRELFVLNAMQTDPNFSNFLWDARTRTVRPLVFLRAEGRG